MSSAVPLMPQQWRYAGIALLLMLLGVVLILLPTSESFVAVWSGGETYNHGFVILPITLWLAWQKRGELAKVAPEPVFMPLLAVALAAIGWLLGHLTGVLVVEQLAMVGILIGSAAAILGWRISLFLAFPLLFLLFAVPMGEDLVPPMMEYTATFTVEALRLTGIPVYREGMWFMLPTGSWSVVEACSGVRYIIASVTLGFLYAYVSYHTLWKRLAFIALSAIVPILANGLRAYAIVMIGHLSDMQLATGIDHLIYGWVFFGVVMLLLFWIGGFWQEPHPPIRLPEQATPASHAGPGRFLGVLIAALAIPSLAQGLAVSAKASGDTRQDSIATPAVAEPWRLVEGESYLAPTYLPTEFVLRQNLARGEDRVSLFAALYPAQRQGYEAISGDNAVVGDDRGRQQSQVLSAYELQAEGLPQQVNQYLLTRKVSAFRMERILVWQWHRIAGHDLNGRYQSKWQEAWSRIFDGRADGAWIAVATEIDGEASDAAAGLLADFVHANYPAIARELDKVSLADE